MFGTNLIRYTIDVVPKSENAFAKEPKPQKR
jgi:hypothetical protein